MAALLGSKSLPPGFRFHPTDEELFMFYLKRKVLGKSLGPQMMSEVDVYRFAPWELPAKTCLKNRDLNWYLCPRLKKCPNGGRSNRATIHGYWKSTGIDRTVNFKKRPVGKIKTLIFHKGKAPKGDRTDWVMHEYRLEDRMLLEQGVAQDSYVICKIYEKSGLGPKNGENYGAPFVEEEWDSDIDDNLVTDHGLTLNPEGCTAAANPVPIPPIPLHAQIQQPLPLDVAHSPNGSGITTTLGRRISAGLTPPSTAKQQACAPMEVLLPPIEMEYDEMDRLLAMFTEDDNVHVAEEEIFNGLEDLDGGRSVSKEYLDWSQYLFDDCYIALDDLN